MKRILYLCCGVLMIALMGCSRPSSAAVQTRNDLTKEHLSGLTSGMKRADVVDLIGENDEALASKEDLDVYTLADGTTAILRYKDDVLQSAFIRDTDNFEDALFNIFERPSDGNNTQTNTGNIDTDSQGVNTNLNNNNTITNTDDLNNNTNSTDSNIDNNTTNTLENDTNTIYESTSETTTNNNTR